MKKIFMIHVLLWWMSVCLYKSVRTQISSVIDMLGETIRLMSDLKVEHLTHKGKCAGLPDA